MMWAAAYGPTPGNARSVRSSSASGSSSRRGCRQRLQVEIAVGDANGRANGCTGPDSRRGPRLDRTPRGCRRSFAGVGNALVSGPLPPTASSPRCSTSRSPCGAWRSTRSSWCRRSSPRLRRRSGPAASCRHRSRPTRGRGRSRPSRRSPRDRDRGAAPGAPPRPRRPGPKDPRPVRGSRRRRRSSGPHGCAHVVVCHVSCAA